LIEPIFDEVCEMSGVTLTRYMMEVSRANPHLKEIESLMNSIQTACKVRRALSRRRFMSGRGWDGLILSGCVSSPSVLLLECGLLLL